VVGAVTAFVNAKEEAKRMTPMEGNVAAGVAGRVAGTAGTVADVVVGGTLGTVVKAAQSALLGEVPDEAKEGSFQSTEAEDVGRVRRRGPLRAVGGLWRRIRGRGAASADAVADADADAVLDEEVELDECEVDDDECNAQMEEQLLELLSGEGMMVPREVEAAP